MLLSLDEKKRKLREDDILVRDLPEYLQQKAAENAKVHILKIGRWVRIGDTWLLVKSTGADMDDAWAYIVARPNVPFLNWLLLPFARTFGKTEEVLHWHEVPGTKVILDFWYFGDGTGGFPIAFQSK